MGETVFNQDWMALDWHADDKTLELKWKEATAGMGGEGFQLSLAMYAAEAAAHGAKSLLVDTRAFRFGDFQSVEEWRQRTIIPLYNHGGARRFAYIFPESFDLPPQKEADNTESFATRYFHSYDDARSWLRQ